MLSEGCLEVPDRWALLLLLLLLGCFMRVPSDGLVCSPYPDLRDAILVQP